MGWKVDPASFDINISNVKELTLKINMRSASMAIINSGLVDVFMSKTN